MSLLDSEQIIDNIFTNEMLELQLAHIKKFLYDHSSYIIYKHCTGADEWSVPKEFKYIPSMSINEDGLEVEYIENIMFTKERLAMFDLVLEDNTYKLRGRGGGLLLTPGKSDYTRFDNDCIKLHESIILDNCEFVRILSMDKRKYLKVIDGAGNEFNATYG